MSCSVFTITLTRGEGPAEYIRAKALAERNCPSFLKLISLPGGTDMEQGHKHKSFTSNLLHFWF